MSFFEPREDPTPSQSSPRKLDDPLPIPGLFFVGTDTEVGKTYQAARLVKCLRQRQVRVGVYKPVLSGLASPSESADGPQDDDASILGKAAGLDASMVSRISPQRFAAPLAPPLAAKREGRCVDEELLLSGAHWWLNHCDFLVVEGAGGLMSPVSNGLTVVDLAHRFGFPVVLVAANRLGCISHVLLAVEALQRRALTVSAIILNRLGDSSHSPAGDYQPLEWQEETARGNLVLLRQWLPDLNILEQADLIPDLLKSPECDLRPPQTVRKD